MIRPFPVKTKLKRGGSAILTSTPYKDDLKAILEAKQRKLSTKLSLLMKSGGARGWPVKQKTSGEELKTVGSKGKGVEKTAKKPTSAKDNPTLQSAFIVT